MIDRDQIAKQIMDTYDTPLVAELEVLFERDGEVVRERVAIDFYSDADYLHNSTIKCIYTDANY